MLQTFKAILTGDKIEWIDDKPTQLADQPTEVYVVLVEAKPKIDENNEITLAALKEAELGGGKIFKNVDELFKDLND